MRKTLTLFIFSTLPTYAVYDSTAVTNYNGIRNAINSGYARITDTRTAAPSHAAVGITSSNIKTVIYGTYTNATNTGINIVSGLSSWATDAANKYSYGLYIASSASNSSILLQGSNASSKITIDTYGAFGHGVYLDGGTNNSITLTSTSTAADAITIRNHNSAQSLGHAVKIVGGKFTANGNLKLEVNGTQSFALDTSQGGTSIVNGQLNATVNGGSGSWALGAADGTVRVTGASNLTINGTRASGIHARYNGGVTMDNDVTIRLTNSATTSDSRGIMATSQGSVTLKKTLSLDVKAAGVGLYALYGDIVVSGISTISTVQGNAVEASTDNLNAAANITLNGGTITSIGGGHGLYASTGTNSTNTATITANAPLTVTTTGAGSAICSQGFKSTINLAGGDFTSDSLTLMARSSGTIRNKDSGAYLYKITAHNTSSYAISARAGGMVTLRMSAGSEINGNLDSNYTGSLIDLSKSASTTITGNATAFNSGAITMVDTTSMIMNGNLTAYSSGVINITNANSATMNGNLNTYTSGTLNLNMTGDSVLTGRSSTNNFGATTNKGTTNLTLQDNSIWNITGDSLLTTISTSGSSSLVFGNASTNTLNDWVQLQLDGTTSNLGDGTNITFDMDADLALTLTDANQFQIIQGNFSGNPNQIVFHLPTLKRWIDANGAEWKYEWDLSTFMEDGTLRITTKSCPEPAGASLCLIGLSPLITRRRRT